MGQVQYEGALCATKLYTNIFCLSWELCNTLPIYPFWVFEKKNSTKIKKKIGNLTWIGLSHHLFFSTLNITGYGAIT